MGVGDVTKRCQLVRMGSVRVIETPHRGDTTLTWNPRQLVNTAKNWSLAVGEPHYFWLRKDAVERVLSAVDNSEPDEPTVLFTTALPVESLVIGLETPITTRHGEVYIIGVPGLAAMRDNHLRTAIQYDDASSLTRAQALMGGNMPDQVLRPLALFTQQGRHFSGGWIHMPDWVPSPQDEDAADAELAEMMRTATVKSEVRPLIYGDEIMRVTAAVRSVWTLLNTSEERDATDTTVSPSVVHGSSKDRGDFPVQVVDIRRSGGTGAGGTGSRRTEPLEREYRWQVRGHWRMQPYGPGRTLRRKVWIEEHVAGPDDKPIKPRVNRVLGDDMPELL